MKEIVLPPIASRASSEANTEPYSHSETCLVASDRSVVVAAGMAKPC